MKNEQQPEGIEETGLAKADDQTAPERTRARIVVYGSRLSGASILAEELDQHLKSAGIDNSPVEVTRNVAFIHDTFYGGMNPEDEEMRIPRGVVVLPEMRLHLNGKGMSISTCAVEPILLGISPFDRIKQLCDRHNVPLIRIEHSTTPQMLRVQLRALSPQSGANNTPNP